MVFCFSCIWWSVLSRPLILTSNFPDQPDPGVCHVTLARRMADLEAKEGILLKYRSIQSLELTALQARTLEAITPEKIKEAPLIDLLKAFYILKKAELGLKK